MCIAVVKTKGSNFPTKKQFENCFRNNYHGAGFMYSDGENLIIKKGFMTFENFYEAFKKENISKDKLVFFHFRIATHGLIDGGNTHPFPIVKDAKIMRMNKLKFKGYGLIHNGILSYSDYDFNNRYGSSDYISDTMLFAMKLYEKNSFKYKVADSMESAVASYLVTKDKKLLPYIKDELRYNKIAIMNEHEDLVMFGDWINNNGVYYSNNDYDSNYSRTYYNSDDYGYGGFECCANCQEYFEEDLMIETTAGFMCEKCLSEFETIKCPNCGIIGFKEDFEHSNICPLCKDEYMNERCDCCLKDIENGRVFVTNEDEILCEKCYKLTSPTEIYCK